MVRLSINNPMAENPFESGYNRFDELLGFTLGIFARL